MRPCSSIIVAALLGVSALGGGCELQQQYEAAQKELIEAEEQIERLTGANTALQARIVKKQEQITQLQGLGENRLERLFHVERIELSRYTSGIDLDGKPGHDAIKVYLRPIDQHGSVLKAAGEVTIELYDLGADPKENLVGKYHWAVDQISKQWSSSFVTYHYSFECPWSFGAPKHDEITVRATFVDYLTGKTFAAQKLCKIDLPPVPEPKQ